MLRLILSFFLCLTFNLQAQAEEKITEFDALIEVMPSGDLQVRETISVIVEGHTIRRGIFRDLPRFLRDGEYNIPQRYEFLSIKRNGAPEPYFEETDGKAKRVIIGNSDVFLPHGLHTYEITYTVKDQVRRTADFDEIYWNVTGNYWRYSIDRATATIRMPSGSVLLSQHAYTGKLRDTGSDAIFSQAGTDYVFRTTRPFDPREGLSVSLTFDKGIIAPPSAETRRFLWWVKNGALTILSVSLVIILSFYYRAWNRVGRDPLKDPIFARYEPPKNYSPAAVSYLHYKGIRGHKALISTLMSLAIKKHLHIDTDKKKTVIEHLGHNLAHQNRDENILSRTLFPSSRSNKITLKKTPNTQFNTAYEIFRQHLAKHYGKNYFKWNGGYMILGVVLTIIAIGLAVSQMFGNAQPAFAFLIGGLIILNILFFWLLPAPTIKGQKVMSEIDGFKLYLETAEKLRLNAYEVGQDQPPLMTTEHYEAMLPYAIALGVEKPWSKYFETIIPNEAENYQPTWAGSHRGNYSNISSLTDSVVSNISSGVSSAAPQSSSSSGSAGGGFSGGGGGGGGGGGW